MKLTAVDLEPSDFKTINSPELYTNDEASRETGVKSPRVYFILGTYGFVYILFFDPYHEINP
jgi:hypothetical protein